MVHWIEARKTPNRTFLNCAQSTFTLTSIAKGFVNAPEFVAKADSDGDGTLSNDEFLTHMYVNVFQREPDNEGYVWWLGQLDDGHKSSDLVLVEMTQSNEYVELTLLAVVDYLVA